MEESALRDPLEVIERQQYFILLLLVGVYVFGSSWFLVKAITAVTVWHAALGLAALVGFATTVSVYRRRQANE